MDCFGRIKLKNIEGGKELKVLGDKNLSFKGNKIEELVKEVKKRLLCDSCFEKNSCTIENGEHTIALI